MPLNYLQQSTNPAFPGVAMRRPPNTHARHAQPKKRDATRLESEEHEGFPVDAPVGTAPGSSKKVQVSDWTFTPRYTDNYRL
jgi:hypothetical protein